MDVCRQEYNRRMKFEYESTRDFIILHYHQTVRNDTPFWDYVRTMEIPETLQKKMDLFREQGYLYHLDNELFNIQSWLQVMVGQGMVPLRYNPTVDRMPLDYAADQLNAIEHTVKQTAANMPTHVQFLAQFSS